jgi:uncharacterized protein (DUF1810 family)
MQGFNLERFLAAQAPVYAAALRELRAGEKESHWMWFIFPQFAGLGRSAMARHFGIGSQAEARAYLSHPVLGGRLVECTEAVVQHRDLTAKAIFGSVDAMKFRSSMTLFEHVATDPRLFAAAIDQFHQGERDAETLKLAERRG